MRLFLLFCLFFISITGFSQNDSLNRNSKTDSGYFTSFDGTKIYYEVRGEGRPVVLVHGFISNSNSWKNTALYNDLPAAGYQVIIMDLRGNGKSGKPHNPEAYAQDAEAKDVMGLLDKLKIKSYQVVGYSRGSIITARLLVLDKRVKAAVLGGMGTGFTNPNWPRRIMFYEALSGKPVKELESMVQYVRKAGLDTVALAYLQKEQPSTSPAALAKIRQPILIIHGDQDSDNGSAEALAKMFPNATIAVVPGDHGHASSTKEFSENVLHFLKTNQ